MKLRAVIFDLWGTLVANLAAVRSVGSDSRRSEFARTVHEMAAVVSIPRDLFERHWTASFDQRATGVFTLEENILQIARWCGVEVSADRVAEAARMRHELTERSLIPVPGAVETIRELRRRGLKLGLISDCTSEVPPLWPGTPLAPLIDAAIFSCSVGIKKPDPRIYALACDRLDVTPQECLYVGDGGGRELTGAAGVGMKPILIRDSREEIHDSYRQDSLDWRGPVIHSLEEVLQCVEH